MDAIKRLWQYRFLARRIRQRARAAQGGKSEQLHDTARAFEKIAEGFERVAPKPEKNDRSS